jgi:hypothetical protein
MMGCAGPSRNSCRPRRSALSSCSAAARGSRPRSRPRRCTSDGKRSRACPDARQVLRLDAGSLLHNAEQLTLASHQANAIGEHARATDLALHADRCLQSALTTTVASMRRDEQTAAAHSNWSERLRCSSRPSKRPQSHGRLGETAHRLQWNAGTNPVSDRLVYESWHGRRRLQGPCPSETRVRNQRLSLGAVHEF